MSDFLSRLAGRALEALPAVQPYVAPRFAPEVEAPAPHVAEPRFEREVAPARDDAPMGRVSAPLATITGPEGAARRAPPHEEEAPPLPSPPGLERRARPERAPRFEAEHGERTAPTSTTRTVHERVVHIRDAPVPSVASVEAPGGEADAPAPRVEAPAAPMTSARAPDAPDPVEAPRVVHPTSALAARPEAPRSADRGAREGAMPPPEPTVVRVSIGRVEVRAAPPPRAPAPAPRAAATTPRSSLDEYLRQRA